jgi:hypothetical protein
MSGWGETYPDPYPGIPYPAPGWLPVPAPITIVVLVLFQSCYPTLPCPSQPHMPRHHTLPAACTPSPPPSQPHGPHRCAPPSYMLLFVMPLPATPTTSPPRHASCSHMGHVTMPLPAAWAMSPHPFQLHGPCHLIPPSCMHFIVAPSQHHMPHHCTSPRCVHHVTALLTATCTTSLSLIQLCAPHCHPLL